MSRWGLMSLMLAGIVACTAVAVAFTQHLSRAAWADISATRVSIDELDVQWSQLQIERSTFSGHARVERAARERLDMIYPSLQASRMIVRATGQVSR